LTRDSDRGSTPIEFDVEYFAMKRIKKRRIVSGQFAEYTVQEKQILL